MNKNTSQLAGIICAGVFSLGFVSTANAAVITDTATVDGTTWAQASLFTNLSWNDMNTQCPAGVCGAGSSLNGWDLNGWGWATASEVGDLLFSSISSHPGGIAAYSEINSTWAPNMFTTTGFNNTGANGFGKWISGITSDSAGRVAALTDEYGPYNYNDTITSDQFLSSLTTTSSSLGGWFYEVAPVPVPAAVWLFSSGLLGLIGVARRKA